MRKFFYTLIARVLRQVCDSCVFHVCYIWGWRCSCLQVTRLWLIGLSLVTAICLLHTFWQFQACHKTCWRRKGFFNSSNFFVKYDAGVVAVYRWHAFPSRSHVALLLSNNYYVEPSTWKGNSSRCIISSAQPGVYRWHGLLQLLCDPAHDIHCC